jgi:hypothetical protein
VLSVEPAFDLLVRSPLTERDVSIPGITRASKVLGALTGEPLRLREPHELVHCGGYTFPEMKVVQSGMRRCWVQLEGSPVGERIAGIGLIAMIFHPLSDGNGRLTRLLWLRGLLQWGLPVEGACELVALLLADRAELSNKVEQYMLGQSEPFVAHWNATAGIVRDALPLQIK